MPNIAILPKPAAPKPKHAGGRPTAYRSEFCGRVIELMAEGRSLDGCASLLGVHPDSLYEWQNRHREFSDAVRAGRAAATTFWEDQLLHVAKGGSGNAQAIQWALRNRSRAASGWHHDAQRLEHTGPDGGPIKTVSAPPLDLSALPYHLREELRAVLVAQLEKAKQIDGSCEEG